MRGQGRRGEIRALVHTVSRGCGSIASVSRPTKSQESKRCRGCEDPGAEAMGRRASERGKRK